MKFVNKEHQLIEREKWLVENGRTSKDVMDDERGEYIVVEPALMDEGEDESGELQKVYLPKELNEDYEPQ